MKKLLSAAALSLLGALVVVPAGPASARASVDIDVATFNIQSISLDKTSGEQRPWRDRRATVVRQILSEGIDVVGLQEANMSNFFRDRTVNGINQAYDLRNGLNAAGGNYALSNYAAWNCENKYTKYKCEYRYRAASGDNRIIYNKNTLTQLKRGTYKFRAQGSAFLSYMPWALFETKATGARFLFTTTHLTNGADSTRRAQWKELIAKVNKLRSTWGVPVVVVGDFNTHKFSSVGEDFLPAMKNNGYGDVTGQKPYTNRLDYPRADRRINAWINSYNRLSRNVRNYSYYDDRTRAGNTIDWIFASNHLNIPEYELVLDFGSDLQVNGTMPSDHNMLRAEVTIP